MQRKLQRIVIILLLKSLSVSDGPFYSVDSGAYLSSRTLCQ
jgi:hypothetical protein